MAYQTLYLKYRSQRFGDLVGQDAIAQTLRNAVEQGRVAHAYLFCGVRGTGKTSTARILAKAINCLDRRGAEPCGVCANCVEIGSGAAVDMIEIDAASNRGIDEIRDLRERVKYLPATLKVKVYIIDEAHMLTTEAFNALLKTLEEPPAHVVFVLATTEPHKIPLTVASRCQRFDFRRIDTGAIAAHLASIVEQEQVKVDPQSLALLARLARGSMRDGITLLDQLISQGGEELTVQKTHELLGLADPDTLVRLLEVTLLSAMAQPVRVAVPVAAPTPDAVGGERVIEPAMDAEPAVLGPDPRWDALKQKLPKPVGSLLMDAQLAEVKDSLVRIEFRYPAHAELMNGAKNRETLLVAVREIFGVDARVELVAGEKHSAPAPAPPVRQGASIADDPLVKEAMNRFDATNVRVTPRGRG